MDNKEMAFDLISILVSALDEKGFCVKDEIQKRIEGDDLTEEQKEALNKILEGHKNE